MSGEKDTVRGLTPGGRQVPSAGGCGKTRHRGCSGKFTSPWRGAPPLPGGGVNPPLRDFPAASQARRAFRLPPRQIPTFFELPCVVAYNEFGATGRGQMQKPKTLGELKKSHFQSVSIKDEMRANLLRKLAAGEAIFPGIIGFDDTVTPQIVNAILSKHNFILLGLRGQAKSRILRSLGSLLDRGDPHRCRLRNQRRPVPSPLPGMPRTPAGDGRRDAHRLSRARATLH